MNSRSPRIFFVNRFFFPDLTATSQLLSDLAFTLAERGFSVTVIASRLRNDVPRALLPRRESIRGVEVVRVRTSRFGGEARLRWRALDYLSFYLPAMLALLARVRRGDLIVAKTDPPLVSVFASGVARLRGARLVNWLQDVFPEIAEKSQMGIFLGGRFARWLRKLRDGSLHRALVNVVLGESMRRTIAARGVPQVRIRVIANWVDERKITPLARDKRALRAPWGLEGKFVAGYSGNMGQVHEFDTILSAAARLARREDLVFLFIGRGKQRGIVEGEVKVRGLKNVRFKPYQDPGMLRESLGALDVHFVTQKPAVEGLVFPSKLYAGLAAGRPVIFIGPTDGDVARVLREGGCGLAFAAGDADGVAGAIEQLAADRARGEAMGANGRRMLESRFSRDGAIAAWEELLRETTR
jgi:colanic acid biosynthesis glycosyl transferase WcaI